MLVSQNHIEYAEVVAALHARCFEKGWTIQEISTLLGLPTTRLFIIEQGFLLCSEVAGEMEILSIGILPEFRKRGFAFSLLQEMIDYAKMKQVEHIFLEVAQDNQPAQALYHKAGFQKIGTRHNYYHTKNGFVDALCLGLQIQKR